MNVDQKPLADRLSQVKLLLADAIRQYLAGDSRAWDQALVLQARLEALRAIASADTAVGPATPLPTCQHPGCQPSCCPAVCVGNTGT
jgi:hypothetical protein